MQGGTVAASELGNSHVKTFSRFSVVVMLVVGTLQVAPVSAAGRPRDRQSEYTITKLAPASENTWSQCNDASRDATSAVLRAVGGTWMPFWGSPLQCFNQAAGFWDVAGSPDSVPFQALPTSDAGLPSGANAISPDGLSIVGWEALRENDTDCSHLRVPVLWTRNGTAWVETLLPHPEGAGASVTDVNDGAATITGSAYVNVPWGDAVVWRMGAGGWEMELLPTLDVQSVAQAVSDDGTLVFGSSGLSIDRADRPVYWTLDPLDGEWTGPFDLGTTADRASGLARETADTVTVGLLYQCIGSTCHGHATRWLRNEDGSWGEPQDLGTLPGGVASGAHAVNGPGTIVGGSDKGEPPEGPFGARPDYPFRWDSVNGMVDLNDLVPRGWVLDDAAVSIDAMGRIGTNGVRKRVDYGCVLVPTR